jgi:hypothetical protein
LVATEVEMSDDDRYQRVAAAPDGHPAAVGIGFSLRLARDDPDELEALEHARAVFAVLGEPMTPFALHDPLWHEDAR